MALMEKQAEITWQGDLRSGSGRLSVASGAFPEQEMTFSARTEPGDGKTSPEELIAAAHSTCYAMSLSNKLSQNGTPAESLHVRAVCSLDRVEGGLKITTMQLFVDGVVPGVEGLDFNRIAAEAEKACPVSNALRGNVDIQLKPLLTTGG